MVVRELRPCRDFKPSQPPMTRSLCRGRGQAAIKNEVTVNGYQGGEALQGFQAISRPNLSSLIRPTAKAVMAVTVCRCLAPLLHFLFLYPKP